MSSLGVSAPVSTGKATGAIRNNPAYRNSNLLYCNSSRRGQNFRRTPLAYASYSSHLESRPSIIREDASPCPVTNIRPFRTLTSPGYVAVDENIQGSIVVMDSIPTDYHSYPLPDLTHCLPQISSNPFDSIFGAYPEVSSISDSSRADIFTDPWKDPFSLLPAQPQYPPSLPPMVPEEELPPHPPFGYHQCGWLSGTPCDGIAPGKNREMAEHLRVKHNFIGHERDVVNCEWENCGQTMQRMNVPRHIVSRHLLEAAKCRICGKRLCRPDVVSRHEKTCGRPTVDTNSKTPQKSASRSYGF